VPVAYSLTATAGFVDVVGYLVLHSIYTANMTGNLISVGICMLGLIIALDLARPLVTPKAARS